MMLRMRTRNQQSGFTLIEMITVIAIIAILASLLLPALSSAKSRARQVACLNGLKHWNLAALMYKDDSLDLLPREKCVDADHTWADVVAPMNSDVWFNTLPPGYLQQPGANGYAADPISFCSSQLFQCPTARFPGNTVEPRFSLAMNSQLSKGTNLLQNVLFSSIQYPAETVLFLECGVQGETPQVCATQKPYNSRPYSWAIRLSARHNLGSNLTFGDGHAQWFAGLKVVDPSTGKGYPPPTDVLWTP